MGTAVSVARVRPGRKKGMGAVRRLIRFIKNLKRIAAPVPLIMDYLEQGPLFSVSPYFARIHR